MREKRATPSSTKLGGRGVTPPPSYLRLMIFVNFDWISRPWDLSHRIWADFLSNLPYKLVKMVGYGSENDPVSSDFEIFTFIFCFFNILVTKLRPAVFVSGKKHVPGFLEHALSGFDQIAWL